MTLEEDRNARCPPEQNFPNVVLSGSPSMISTYSSLQLRNRGKGRHQPWESWSLWQAASPVQTPHNHTALCTRLPRLVPTGKETHPSGVGGGHPGPSPPQEMQVTPCLLGNPTDGAQGSPPRTLGSGATGGHSTANPEDRFLGQQARSQVSPRQACVMPLLLHPLHP